MLDFESTLLLIEELPKIESMSIWGILLKWLKEEWDIICLLIRKIVVFQDLQFGVLVAPWGHIWHNVWTEAHSLDKDLRTLSHHEHGEVIIHFFVVVDNVV